jgi:hypothetical protein
VIAWYRSGAEVQSLLPALATHLWIATYSEKSPRDPVMRLFRAIGATREALFLIAAFCRLENSLSCSEHMGWLVGAVGIELKTTLKARKLLIPVNAKNDKNTEFAQARYTAGTRRLQTRLSPNYVSAI